MKYKFIRILCFDIVGRRIAACTPGMKSTTEKRYAFADILDISYTPDTLHRCYGWFTDAGSWMASRCPNGNNGSTASAAPSASICSAASGWHSQPPS
mgnify:CR=1 FL=1